VAALLRREPHRLLFPLGAILAGAGVIPWLVFAFGVTEAYRPIFHSIAYRAIFHPLAEVEGFLSCFAAGFVLSVLPRRTGTPPPSAALVALSATVPVAAVLCAWLERWALTQVIWLALLVALVGFALPRVRGAGARAAPATLVWTPLALLMGAAGAVVGAAGAALGREWVWLHDLGRGLLLQGLFTGLVLGSLGELVPGGAADVSALRRRVAVALHGLGATAYLASFAIGALGAPRLAFALRAAVTFAAVGGPLLAARGAPGWRPLGTALSMAMLPLGNAFVAIAPRYRRAGLHLIYLGCFAALAIAMATSLGTPHEPIPERVATRRNQLAWAAALLVIALASRVLLELDAASFHLWLGTSSAAFLGSMSLGGALAVRRGEEAGRRGQRR
jgi:uncharacterized protein involved in response to NO